MRHGAASTWQATRSADCRSAICSSIMMHVSQPWQGQKLSLCGAKKPRLKSWRRRISLTQATDLVDAGHRSATVSARQSGLLQFNLRDEAQFRRWRTSLTQATGRPPSCTSTERCLASVCGSSHVIVGLLSDTMSDTPSVQMPQPSVSGDRSSWTCPRMHSQLQTLMIRRVVFAGAP